jgi:signal transduction histidine kinase
MILRIRWRGFRWPAWMSVSRRRPPRSASLRLRLRLSMIGLVALLALVQGLVTLRMTAESQFQDAVEKSQAIAFQVRSLLVDSLNQRTAMANPPPATLEETVALWTSLLEGDPSLEALLEKLLASSRVAVEIQVCDRDGRILASSSPARRRVTYRSLESLDAWSLRRLWDRLYEVLVESKEYATVLPLGVPQLERPLFTIHVIVSSVLLRHGILPPMRSIAITSLATILAAVLLAVVFSNVVVRSLDALGRRIDLITSGEFPSPGEPPPGESREVAAVTSKLDLLSAQYRGAREDALQLRGNIDRLLESLEAAVLMFDVDHRLVLAGRPAEALLGARREEIVGRTLETLFPPATPVGAAIEAALRERIVVRDRPAMLVRPHLPPLRVLLSVDLLERPRGLDRLGILVTLRDVESRRQLRSQLDVSSRLAAINRLTGGVAHEIKNPLNAIALHLEVLKAKLAEPHLVDPELRVIEREIARLDRVVKTFLDFTRPFELKIATVDLDGLLREVAALVAPEASRSGVVVEIDAGGPGALVRGDRDLLKQAILNVVVNGIEAMPNGGRLRLGVERAGEDWVVRVADEGHGIPPDLRDRIFDLYFTTKEEGTGIGLAMTFRVIHLHNATIDFTSEVGRGATFWMRFPAAEELAQAMAESAAGEIGASGLRS